MSVVFEVGGARGPSPLISDSFYQWVFPDGTLWAEFHRADDGYWIRFPELADFWVASNGLHARGWSAEKVSTASLEHLYLNQVLPLALSRQGKLVLHGSAVQIPDAGAVAFIGESGRGKSTLAASFATSGFHFFTDDGLQLDWDIDQCMVLPSHPSIRLWADSQEALMGKGVIMAPAVEFTRKSRFLAGPEVLFAETKQALRRVYFLGDSTASEPQFDQLNPAQALIELVKNSFLLDVEEHAMLAAHFDALSRLAALPIYFRLDYPRRYEDLPAIRQAIVQHASLS